MSSSSPLAGAVAGRGGAFLPPFPLLFFPPPFFFFLVGTMPAVLMSCSWLAKALVTMDPRALALGRSVGGNAANSSGCACRKARTSTGEGGYTRSYLVAGRRIRCHLGGNRPRGTPVVGRRALTTSSGL